MSEILSENNCKKAFCKVLNCCGYGAANYQNWTSFINLKVKLTMNPNLIGGFLDKVLNCSIQICTIEPYNWKIRRRDRLIELDDNTSFKDIYQNMFKQIINN